MNQIPLTVVVITKNEESNITRCLTSVLGWVDEVVIYDSGSVDQTVQVASKLGARVVSGEWLGFGPTKTYGLWLMILPCCLMRQQLKKKRNVDRGLDHVGPTAIRR